MASDLYVLLGVGTNASSEQIKAAYRRRAKELHPDYHGANAEPFLRVQQAYAVLQDPERRRHYDKQAASAERGWRRARPEPMRDPRLAPGRQFGHTHQFSVQESPAEYRPSFDELFERLWDNFNLSSRPKAERLQPLTVEIPLSPDEAILGGAVTLLVPARAECPSCLGGGSVGPYECWRCQGQGAITADMPVEIEYPAGVRHEWVAHVPLSGFGISNFYLVVRFRVSDSV
jgi:molecular chaperone DnaJ